MYSVYDIPIKSVWVSPFGHPRVNACLGARRGFSHPATSFIVVLCQGIHHVPLWNLRTTETLSSVLCFFEPYYFLTRLCVNKLSKFCHDCRNNISSTEKTRATPRVLSACEIFVGVKRTRCDELPTGWIRFFSFHRWQQKRPRQAAFEEKVDYRLDWLQ